MIMIPGEGLYRLDQQVGQTHVHFKAVLQFAEVPVVFLTKNMIKSLMFIQLKASMQIFEEKKGTAKQKMF